MTEKILIIDDEPNILQVLRYLFNNGLEKGYQFTEVNEESLITNDQTAVAVLVDDYPFELFTFTKAREALNWCAAGDPDLVIVDYLMPEMNGLQFIELFRAMPAKEYIPVILFTGFLEPEIRYQALKLGASDFLNKPIDRLEFGLRINNWLSLHRSNKKLAHQAKTLNIEIEKATRDILEREQEMIFRLSKAVEYREMETGAHIMRTAYFARTVAESLGLSETEQYLVLKTAPMHDIGKVGIPDRILHKSGNLNKEEYEIMKQHTIIGHRILQGSSSHLLQTAAEIALTHHERYNGSGYPGGLYGDKIPLYGKIMALVDVFDALTSRRGYKKAWETGAAFDYINDKSGKHFDPECVKAFLAKQDSILAIIREFSDDSTNVVKSGNPTSNS